MSSPIPSGGGAPVVYNGNWPRNVNKDAKYTIKSEKGAYVVGVIYHKDDRETWRPTNDEHPDLVEMVNRIKLALNDAPGGPFYINEYHQVIVPIGDEQGDVDYYFAGDYSAPLVFELDGCRLSGQPFNLQGGRLAPGDKWEGVHHGIPYILKAGGRDIYYEREVRPRVTATHRLSADVGQERAQELAARLRVIKGFDGGRFYINEFRQLFTGLPYIYLGELGDTDPWFPKPQTSSCTEQP